MRPRIAQHSSAIRLFKIGPVARHRMENIPDIKSFLRDVKGKIHRDADPALLRSEVQDPHSMHEEDISSTIPLEKPSELHGRRFFIETYGCQMNESDSEIVHAVLEGAGLVAASSPEDASVILINTCAVRAHTAYLPQPHSSRSLTHTAHIQRRPVPAAP